MTISNETLNARKLFSNRLKSLLIKSDMTQKELAEKLNVTESTVGKWVLGKAMPRTMGLIQTMADYFGVGKSYFLEETAPLPPADDYKSQPYYIDEETARIANEMKENPGRRVLFDASRKLSPESIKEVQNYIEFLYQKQDDSNDD